MWLIVDVHANDSNPRPPTRSKPAIEIVEIESDDNNDVDIDNGERRNTMHKMSKSPSGSWKHPLDVENCIDDIESFHSEDDESMNSSCDEYHPQPSNLRKKEEEKDQSDVGMSNIPIALRRVKRNSHQSTTFQTKTPKISSFLESRT